MQCFSRKGHKRALSFLFPSSHINSDSFLCDCQLKWLPHWLAEKEQQPFVVATCAHPESLKSKSIFAVPTESFVCGKWGLGVRLCERQVLFWPKFPFTARLCDYAMVGGGFVSSKPAQAYILKISHWLQFISHQNHTSHWLHLVYPFTRHSEY